MNPRHVLLLSPGAVCMSLHSGLPASAIVPILGMRNQLRSWDWIAGGLAERFHDLTPDLFGHGDSNHAGSFGYAMAAFLFDLARIFDALSLTQFGLVGHSLGGAIALRYESALPDRIRAL